ncbi:histidinol-phosphate transaminase [Pontibacterium granulatum]|uniref:histidinol-phosphate transaminase n=1 Tax=Pontibacterium granulatum TaxID=2036029 RepID=UPI00249B6C61|nr:histidinol-phosphate transaminase [Pontibacterium granulatum]MDI3322758.1 histidinol-phosphate transaminase [Pontibacterium granulatum]
MSCDFKALATPGVQGLHPYLPGKPVEELERELGISDIVKLASNENPRGPGEQVRQAVSHVITDLSRYPDSNGFELKRALSQKFDIAENCITLGNGSNDVLDLLGRTFIRAGDEVIYSEYGFLVYALVTQAAEASAVVTPAKNYGHDLEAMAAAITERTRMIFVANPNNPTGTWLGEAELRAFLEKVPSHIIVVLDEAYTEYVALKDFPDGLKLLGEYPNLVVTRTFSKAYGLAAMRVGFAVANEAITDLLNRIRQPFNVNAIALAAAVAALNDEAYLTESVRLNREGMVQLEQGLAKLGLEWIPSAGNFLTVDMQQDAGPLYQALLHEGVIVRPVANYGLPNHLRISIGLPNENQRCLDALAKVLSA